jgi:hypothetical protein
MALYTYLFFKFIDPDLMMKILYESRLRMEEKGLTQSQIEQQMNFLKKFISPGGLSVSVFLQVSFIGLVFSGIIPLLVKHKKSKDA